jgi:tRNA-splicing endonuclease subunit Sen54
VVYHVYKPTTSYKKTAPPPPDFRIAVVSTRDQTTLPTLTQLSALLHSTPLEPPRGEKLDRMMYMRLRHGYRNVVLAVVDQGVVSYLRIGDAAFGKERLFENVRPAAGTKRSGYSGKSRKR